MQLLPETVCKVIIACAVLHNMTREANLPEVDILEEVEEEAENENERPNDNGIQVRVDLIRNRFT